MIEDSYCQGPKPRESESCASLRRRREDANAADGKRGGPSAARSNTLTRQNDFIKVARDSAKTALGDVAGDQCDDREFSPTRQAAAGESKSSVSRSIGAEHIDALPNTRRDLTPSDDSRNLTRSREDRPQLGKRSGSGVLNDDEEKVGGAHEIKKGEVVVDKEDIRNLTLTIILERDERNVVANFPKDFQPRPPANSTEFVLNGMDALRYIQRIQEEARA